MNGTTSGAYARVFAASQSPAQETSGFVVELLLMWHMEYWAEQVSEDPL